MIKSIVKATEYISTLLNSLKILNANKQNIEYFVTKKGKVDKQSKAILSRRKNNPVGKILISSSKSRRKTFRGFVLKYNTTDKPGQFSTSKRGYLHQQTRKYYIKKNLKEYTDNILFENHNLFDFVVAAINLIPSALDICVKYTYYITWYDYGYSL